MSQRGPIEAPGSPRPAGTSAAVEPSGLRAKHESDDDLDPSRAARSRLGQTIAGYSLESVLGVGGTATVYKGVRNHEVAALKLLHAWLNADPRARKRFLREATIAARVKHPAIVRMLAEGETSDATAYIVMELADGQTLEARRAARDGRLPLDEVLRLTDELLAVLEVAHEQGVVHRDIKPANLLIAPDNHLRVLDFGIARVTELSDTSSLVTRTGAVLGTVFFMAPEQALGVRDDIDARCDVWAVGATMFTLLTGHFVHRARSANEALVLAATQPAPPALSVLPELPRPIARVIDRALAFDRHERFANAGTMRSALARALAGEVDAELSNLATLPETATLPEQPLPGATPAPGGGRPRRAWLSALFVAAGAAVLVAVAQTSGAFRSQSIEPTQDSATSATTSAALTMPGAEPPPSRTSAATPTSSSAAELPSRPLATASSAARPARSASTRAAPATPSGPASASTSAGAQAASPAAQPSASVAATSKAAPATPAPTLQERFQ